MNELKRQFVSTLLVILTTALVITAFVNFQQNRKFQLPDDGAVWVDRGTPAEPRVEALDVIANGPVQRAGIRPGDILRSIKGSPITRSTEVAEILFRQGAWKTIDYQFERDGVVARAQVNVRQVEPKATLFYQYLVGVVYLAIGLFVYFRRGSAPKSLHFYVLCLSSFVMSTFHFTGKLNAFDTAIYIGNVVAGFLAPTIFLHFCLTFPEKPRWLRGSRVFAVYVPALAFIALNLGVISGTLQVKAIPSFELRWLLDRAALVFLSFFYLAGAAALHRRFKRAEDTIVRQQLKWLRNGALIAILPFTALYIVPYVAGAIPGEYLGAAVFSMVFLPLTWAYAIIRYRLMDVDVIFQQGYVHTLATLSVLGVVYGLLLTLGKFEELSPTALVFLILLATFIFQPIRNWIQEVLDRYYFYKESYDYRRTLIEFARELGSETDLDRMLESVSERLTGTLAIQHVAFFLYDEERGEFQLRHEAGVRRGPVHRDYLDLSFLRSEPERPYLFFERTRNMLDVQSLERPASVRQTIADLDLTYYMPCTLRGRTIAYLAASRTDKGDFLSSEDVDLLVAIAGYVGIAIENARLYRSLQSKVEEYERLKEYSENIVESINVGILAVDLDDRVEGWNNQIERLTGIPRDVAVGRRLHDLFPRELCNQFDAVRGQTGIHHIYKFPLPVQTLPLRAAAVNGHNGGSNGVHHPAPPRESILNLAIAPLVSRDQEQIGRLIIFDDVTDRAELERRLVQADKLSSIGLLAAGVAHEVNTPLAVISTYAQMLAKQVTNDEQKARMLDKIAKSTFRASEIVNGLLNFSRTSSTEFEELDLNKVLRETVALIEHQLQKARVEVRFELEDHLPPIKGNTGKLQQVFLNLVLNARDAMESGGLIRIRSRAGDGLAQIEIVDNGQGIAPEHVTRIFDPFFTTKAGKKGTGLGLSVSYGIVQEHGGTIEVRSQQGLGTTFQLAFPLVSKPVHA
ncbi:MAG: ATP-binding protein [Bryobacteraceae bacterium]|nr:ATP-binding protein [Bryobacteraceae bacterium]